MRRYAEAREQFEMSLKSDDVPAPKGRMGKLAAEMYASYHQDLLAKHAAKRKAAAAGERAG